MHARDNRVHITWFDDQVIALDLKSDRYTVLSPAQSKKLETVSKYNLKNNGCSQLAPKHTGVPVNCWKLTPGQLRLGIPAFDWIKLLATLHRVHRISREDRMLGLIEAINNERTKIRPSQTRVSKEDLIRSLNLACMAYIRKTKCLEWAATLIIAGYRYGFDFSLVIGVQNRPFFAHAWVESDGSVVGDHPDRRTQLAVIYEFPKNG
ncbi:lasso peptide biosynthesis B2 protein [Burkholderia multivorans]|uniref:lasso peptide biosynthesis B2 protein n=1 Tax=Burkholderia TaxID=32008 RepID=UPI0009BED57F|nr:MULTISPECIES: lasso peptide biosynthesis B2 protein [Burkholderia]MCA8073831.1 lasso peptide biosynthesis B2 protein [Burkholderia vietnamiensis]MCA8482000.1 lasso peptide biosynthesis B2 protein [Burkholderia multivorans]MCO1371377.1 lasso peptide biosynthesis B2 protein [Burkholderia multivorans]MCO1457374.1 lasso peptide biosynthesis B2 protein [Burkholderia multivorans]MCO1466361.1 lasso peptide biosynthesis B2 protein [Burkholderia multivorans]